MPLHEIQVEFSPCSPSPSFLNKNSMGWLARKRNSNLELLPSPHGYAI